MRYVRTVVSVAAVLSGLWLQAPAQDRSGGVDSYELKKMIDRADYSFANHKMYRDQQTWVGKTIEVRGTRVTRPVIMPDKTTYVQISGTSDSGDPINVVAILDRPMEDPQLYGDRSQTFAAGVPIRAFGVLQRCRDLVDQSGHVLFLPVMDLLAVYRLDDQSYVQPIWVSRALAH